MAFEQRKGRLCKRETGLIKLQRSAGSTPLPSARDGAGWPRLGGIPATPGAAPGGWQGSVRHTQALMGSSKRASSSQPAAGQDLAALGITPVWGGPVPIPPPSPPLQPTPKPLDSAGGCPSALQHSEAGRQTDRPQPGAELPQTGSELGAVGRWGVAAAPPPQSRARQGSHHPIAAPGANALGVSRPQPPRAMGRNWVSVLRDGWGRAASGAGGRGGGRAALKAAPPRHPPPLCRLPPALVSLHLTGRWGQASPWVSWGGSAPPRWRRGAEGSPQALPGPVLPLAAPRSPPASLQAFLVLRL